MNGDAAWIQTGSHAGGNSGTVLNNSWIRAGSYVYNSRLANSGLLGTFAEGSHFVDSRVTGAKVFDSNLVNTFLNGHKDKPIAIVGADVVNGWIDETHPLFYATGSEIQSKKEVTVKAEKDGEKARTETETTTLPGIKIIAYWVKPEDNTGVPTTFNILCDGITFEGPGAVEALRQTFLEGDEPAHWAALSADQKGHWKKAIEKGLGLIEKIFTQEEVQRLQEEIDATNAQRSLDELAQRLLELNTSDGASTPAIAIPKVQGGTWNIGAKPASTDAQVPEPPTPSLS